MIDAPSDTRKALINALLGLPSSKECDRVLSVGGLPIDNRSREILLDRILRIKIDLPLWETIQKQPDWAEAFTCIDKTLNDLLQIFQSDAGQRALEIMEEGAILTPFKDTFRFIQKIRELYHYAHEYREIYSSNKPRRTALENWLFESFYRLHEEIEGAPPAIHGPLLYRFTMAGAKVLGIELNINEHAFRMRLKRHLKTQSKAGLTDPALRMRIQRALNGHYTRSKC